jgi:cysteine desulfurase
MSLPVYLDYAATTPVDQRVAARMASALTADGDFGNPGSSSHIYGERASLAVEQSRAQVAGAIGAEAQDIVWTSGATEANNLAIFGLAQYYQDKKRHIVTVRTEHKAVLDPCRELERRGWRVDYLVPGQDGRVTAEQVAAALRDTTALVSVMHVNNETGIMQDVAAIAEECRRRDIPFHVDAAQSVGKCTLALRAWGVTLASVSAHKAYGPKGAGALFVNRSSGVQLQALQWGGGQERGLRSGTVPTHQVIGTGEAFVLAQELLAAETVRITRLRDRLWRGLESIGGVSLNGSFAFCVPHILNASFEGVEGESLLASVQDRIAVSTGSACTSATQEPSYVLRALGRDDRLAESSLRFSLGRSTTEADVDVAIDTVSGAVQRLRLIAGTVRKGS